MIFLNDTTADSEVKFAIEYCNDRDMLLFSIIPHSEVIYYARDRKSILLPPTEIQLHLNLQNIAEVCESFISHTSVFFEEDYKDERHNVYTANQYNIHLERDISTSSSKVVMTIVDNGRVLIVLRINKSKILFLLNWIKTEFENGNKKNFRLKTKSKTRKYVYEIGRNKDKLLSIRSVLLLQNEINIMRYIVEEVVYTYRPEKVFQENISYKKISLLYDQVVDKAFLFFKDKESDERRFVIPIEPQSAALLYLSISDTVPFTANIPKEIKKVKTNLVTKVGPVYTAFEKKKNELYDFRQKQGGLKAHFCTGTINGVSRNISIDFKNEWNNVMATLFSLYNDDITVYKDDDTMCKWWYFSSIQLSGEIRQIELRIMSRRNEARKATVSIKSNISRTAKENNENEIVIHFSRQDLHGFLTTFLTAVKDIDGYEFSFASEEDKKKRFGIKRLKNKITVSSDKDIRYELSQSDGALLKASSKYMLFHGRWLPFQGENITVSNDGYITDLKREYATISREYGLAQKIALSGYIAYREER